LSFVLTVCIDGPLERMNIAVSWTDGLAVVTTPGEIDITNAGLLRAALLSALEKPPPAIVVDMADTDFCDSTGLNVLVRVQKQAAEQGTALRLVIRAAAVQRMLTVTGVSELFRVYDTLAAALQPD
jgi:anti-anti-sigma factor